MSCIMRCILSAFLSYMLNSHIGIVVKRSNLVMFLDFNLVLQKLKPDSATHLEWSMIHIWILVEFMLVLDDLMISILLILLMIKHVKGLNVVEIGHLYLAVHLRMRGSWISWSLQLIIFHIIFYKLLGNLEYWSYIVATERPKCAKHGKKGMATFLHSGLLRTRNDDNVLEKWHITKQYFLILPLVNFDVF